MGSKEVEALLPELASFVGDDTPQVVGLLHGGGFSRVLGPEQLDALGGDLQDFVRCLNAALAVDQTGACST